MSSLIVPCELAASSVLDLGRQATADKNSEESSSPLPDASGKIVRVTSNRYWIRGRCRPENYIFNLQSFFRAKMSNSIVWNETLIPSNFGHNL